MVTQESLKVIRMVRDRHARLVKEGVINTGDFVGVAPSYLKAAMRAMRKGFLFQKRPPYPHSPLFKITHSGKKALRTD